MDHIRQAILKAKAARQSEARPPVSEVRNANSLGGGVALNRRESHHDLKRPQSGIELDVRQLERNRIVAHLPNHPLSAGFSLLRTRIYQTMTERGWHTIMVTSPTPGCGKTVMSINLAIGLARQPRCSALLVDCDFRKPDIAKYLGVEPMVDLADVVMGGADLAAGVQTLNAGEVDFMLLATRDAVPRPAEVLASRRMRELVHTVEKISEDIIVVFDVPPIAVADDVIAFLPEVDCVLLVLSPGETSYAEVQDSIRSIPDEKLIGTVFTKSRDAKDQKYYYGY